MSMLKRWAAGAAMTGVLLLGAQTGLVAQQPAPPKDGKALATQLGLKGDAAKKLQPQLDKLARAWAQQARLHEEAVKARTDMQTALAGIVPTLTPAQRQQLRSVMVQARGRFGPGAGYGMARGGQGYGMGPGGRGMMGPGGHGMMGPGGHGQWMRGNMGPGMRGRWMRGGMGPAMRGGPGMRGQGYGPGACPFNQAPAPGKGPAGPGTPPDSGPTGPGGR